LSIRIFKSKTIKNRILVSCNVSNTGSVVGAEVVQLYLHDVKSKLERPLNELKGFEKIFLKPGETKRVILELGEEDLAYYDPSSSCWVAEPGDFLVLLGSSSMDIRLKGGFTWK
jgi:beta-glucosidase